jgi:hypothetical protein
MSLKKVSGIALLAAVASPCFGQVLLDNTLIVTHAAQGFNGADASAIMATATPGATLYGASIVGTFRIADDFTVPAGESWNITKIVLYGYQTIATNPFPPTSSFTGLTIRVWNGAPNAGGAIVFGDTTTNRLSASSWLNCYRTTDTDIATAFNRAIFKLEANFTPAIELGAGTYWLDYGATGNAAFTGPWTPPQVRGPTDPVPGVVPGNAIQLTALPNTWAASVNGTSGVQNAYSFNLEGTKGSGCYPDCNGDSALTVADFGCFQTKFVAGCP